MQVAANLKEQGFVISRRRLWVPASLAGLGAAPLFQSSSCRASPSQNLPCAWGCSQRMVENRVGRNLRAHPPERHYQLYLYPSDRSIFSLFIKLLGSPGNLFHGCFTLLARKFLQCLKPASLLLSTDYRQQTRRNVYSLPFFLLHI